MRAVPRNVVTLSPRRLVLPTRQNRETRGRIQSAVLTRYRARVETYGIAIDFPKRKGARAAKDEVAEVLDGVDRRWRRVFVLYPTESTLREKGE